MKTLPAFALAILFLPAANAQELALLRSLPANVVERMRGEKCMRGEFQKIG